MREPGYYWVLYNGDWKPAEWSSVAGGFWMLIGSDGSFNDDDFDAIGDSIER